jgi:hypothetical protein
MTLLAAALRWIDASSLLDGPIDGASILTSSRLSSRIEAWQTSISAATKQADAKLQAPPAQRRAPTRRSMRNSSSHAPIRMVAEHRIDSVSTGSATHRRGGRSKPFTAPARYTAVTSPETAWAAALSGNTVVARAACGRRR